jgi:uncharacterized protein YacL
MIAFILIAQAAAAAPPNRIVQILAALIVWGGMGGIIYFWIKMLLDCLKNEADGSKRIAWVLVIILTNILGATLYYFVVKRNRGKSTVFENQAVELSRCAAR